jgi:hypothetical protein
LAAALTFLLVYDRQRRTRERQQEILRHFQTIADMNDRIRNSLQAIECSTYATNPAAVEPVRSAVDAIETVLSKVIADLPRPEPPSGKSKAQAADNGGSRDVR